MSPAEYQRVREIFHGACERPPGERTAFLDGACGHDMSLRAQVEALLESAAQNSQFLSQTATHIADLAGSHAVPEQPIPAAIGRFRVIRLLGAGGMGAAYEAEQENPSRRVAVKTIRPGLSSPALLRRFTHEAHILGRLRHPGIAQVYEAGVADSAIGSTPYIAMELVAGVPLDQWVRRHTPPRKERIELLARVCDAVQHAHSNSVVHRDLKPANILVEQGSPKVLDFGVARLLDAGRGSTPVATLATDPGTLVGTLAYMSPEQVTGGAQGVDARADVCALGVILFELLTGRLPRDTEGKSIAEAARIVRDEEPHRAGALDRSLRGDLDTICAKAMEREPARRYQTAAELATDLRRFLGNEPIIARPATLMYQARKFARRHTGLVVGMSAAAVALILGLAGTLRYAIIADRQRDRALAQEAAARWTLYKLSVAAAEDSLRSNPARARAKAGEAPAELRNWEWRHVMARLDRQSSGVAGDPGVHLSGAFTAADEPRAAVVRGPRIEIVDPQTNAVLTSFPAPHGISGVALSRDAETLAAWSQGDTEVCVYDTQTQARRSAQSLSGQSILAVGLSPDGSLLGMVLARRGILVCDTRTGEVKYDAPLNILSARSGLIEFSRDNKHMICNAIASEGSEWLSLYDLSKPPPTSGFEEATGAAFDASGRVLATGTIRGIHLHDLPAHRVQQVIHGQMRVAVHLAFSGDGQRLAGFVGKGALHVWNVNSGELERALVVPDSTYGVALNRAGDNVLIACADQVALLPLAEPGISVLRGHTNYVYNVAWSGDGKTVASAAWDGTVRAWDVATGAPRAELVVQPVHPLVPVEALSFSARDSKLLVMTHANELLEYDLAESARIGNASTQPNRKTLSQRPAPIARGEAANAAYWTRARPGAKKIINTGGERDSSSPQLLAHVDGSEVVVIGKADGQTRRRINFDTRHIYATAFSPDGVHLATSTDDHRISMHDLRTGDRTAELRDHESHVFTITFTPDGSRMASGDGDGLIFLWDTAHWEKVAELRGHTSYVHSLAFSPDGATLCSGSGDGTVRLWSAGSPVPISDK